MWVEPGLKKVHVNILEMEMKMEMEQFTLQVWEEAGTHWTLNLPGLEALIDNVTFLVASVSSQKPKGYKTYNYFVAKWLGWYMLLSWDK